MNRIRFLLCPLSCAAALLSAVNPALSADAADGERSVLPVANATATSAAAMRAYTDEIPNSRAKFDMVPVPGGVFTMGSPDDEAGRKEDEGPQRRVRIEPFWMGSREVTWDEYEVFMLGLDIRWRKYNKIEPTALEQAADAVTHPSEPYADMTFGMGKRGYPAICMTQLAARTYCKWLTKKTGRYYRLPTEAEWEYACRAGTSSPYSFGDDAVDIDRFAWHAGNSDEAYHKVGLKKPNPRGLYDMHGNVAEWVLDQYVADHYGKLPGTTITRTLAIPTTLYPRVVRGGSWNEGAAGLRSAARAYSVAAWKEQDPQEPQSIWYHTDALHVGFRIVRPLHAPGARELSDYWDAGMMLPESQPRGTP